MAKLRSRQRNQLPTCYYEGYLEKRSFKDKTSRKLWTCLCGNTLFFFNEKRDCDYVEKVDLSGLISITDDSSQDRNLDAARFNLQLEDGIIKFTAPNGEARELWKGYIRSVAELAVPSSLNLLPGQIHMLKEAVDKEMKRPKNVTQPIAINTSADISPRADMPVCYHSVSRMEAEMLLEKESNKGNLLLRPGSNGNFAVTTRQDLEGPVFRHYRVTPRPDGGFAIDVDNPVLCSSLHDVVTYLVEKTDRVLVPLIFEETYEQNISFIRSDKESGERSVQQTSSPPKPTSFPPEVSPRTRSPEPVPALVPAPAPVAEENVYLNDQLEEKENEVEVSPAPLPPQLEKKPTKKAMMPPTPVPRKMSTSTSALMPKVSLPPSKVSPPPSRVSPPPSKISLPPSKKSLPPSKISLPPSEMSPPPSKMSPPPSPPPSKVSTTSITNIQELRTRSSPEPLRQIPLAAMNELKMKLGQKVKFAQ